MKAECTYLVFKQWSLSFRKMAVTNEDLKFWDLVFNGNIRRVSDMLQHTHRLNIDTIAGTCSDSPLMVAVVDGDVEMMKLLIDNGADCNLRCIDAVCLGETPLFLATKSFHSCALEMMNILIDHGASVTMMSAKGRTVMHFLFSAHGQCPSDADNRLRLLLDNIPNKDIVRLISQKDGNGDTASGLNRKIEATSVADILDLEVQRRRDYLNQWRSERRELTDIIRSATDSTIRSLEPDLLENIVNQDMYHNEVDTFMP